MLTMSEEREAVVVWTFCTTPDGFYPERFTSVGDRVWAREARPDELHEDDRDHIKWIIRPVDPSAVEWADDATREGWLIGVRQGDIVWAEETDRA